MKKESKYILGEITLDTGNKSISPLNDVFINYTFMKEDNWESWESLRKLVNIFITAYIKEHQDTNITTITGKIGVTTQFPFYKNKDSKTPKRQDVKIDSESKSDYIEFQNDPKPSTPIAERSVDYFGFSLTRGEKKIVNNIWLIDGAVPELMDGETFSNYIIMREKDNRPHPNIANILYINLEQLADDDDQAAELAGVLTGKINTPKDQEVKQIFQSFKDSFDAFKNDTKVRDIMGMKEEAFAEGEAKARAELDPIIDEKDELINEKDELIDKKDELIDKLKSSNDELKTAFSELKAMFVELKASTTDQALDPQV